jgi:hypothetical protein
MMDALGKAAQMLDVPRKGLWPLIPGVTNGMLDDWDELHEQQVQDMMQMDPLAQQGRAAGAQKVPGKPAAAVNTAQRKPVAK